MRKIWDIHGGIHPLENKSQSLQSKIQTTPIPKELVLPLTQHIGAAAKPVVKIGAKVLKGECIASAEDFVCAPVHASSSGTVIAIEDRPVAHPSGLHGKCIVIETDGLDQWCELKPQKNFLDLEKAELLNIIRSAGIAGMGGAGFPTSVKLNTSDNIKINTLIINGTECEPYITADHALMRERSEQLAEGIAILARLITPDKILVGIEDNKMDVVDDVKAALEEQDFPSITDRQTTAEVITFPTKYPSGGEKQLIEILTGKQVPAGGLPSQLGIVCQNMGTAVAIRDAVVEGKPLISRITTVTGEAVQQPGNYDTLLGTPINVLLKHTGFNAAQNNRLVMGGPMMGFALQDAAVPVVKTTNCILAPTERELPTPPPAQACIRCGMCAEACPASLLPQQLYWYAQGKELEKLEAHNLADCIECGACSYVCPSHIPLVQYYRASKAEIHQRDIDMRNAEYSKQRFDARQDRLERQEQEKIAARKARQAKAAAKKAAGGEDPKAAAVAAAMARVNAKKATAQTSPQSQAQPGANQSASQRERDEDDPVARALAKRNAQAGADPVDPDVKLEQALESAEKRLDKARSRYAEAQASNDGNVDAYRAAIEKTELKIRQIKADLSAIKNSSEGSK